MDQAAIASRSQLHSAALSPERPRGSALSIEQLRSETSQCRAGRGFWRCSVSPARESRRCGMKRRLPGLSQAAVPTREVQDGIYVARVERAQYRWDKQKPYYAIRFSVLEPKRFLGTSLSGRLYCTEKALVRQTGL